MVSFANHPDYYDFCQNIKRLDEQERAKGTDHPVAFLLDSSDQVALKIMDEWVEYDGELDEGTHLHSAVPYKKAKAAVEKHLPHLEGTLSPDAPDEGLVRFIYVSRGQAQAIILNLADLP